MFYTDKMMKNSSSNFHETGATLQAALISLPHSSTLQTVWVIISVLKQYRGDTACRWLTVEQWVSKSS